MSVPKRAIFLVLLLSAIAASQAQTDKTARKHDLEVFGGYSYLYPIGKPYPEASFFPPSGSGFNVGLDFRIHRPLSLEGEVSVFPTTSCGCSDLGNPIGTTFVFGPRYSFPVPESFRFKPFAGVLLGASAYTSNAQYVRPNNVSFAFDFQGGLDYRLTSRLAIRGAGAYVRSTLSNAAPGGPSEGYGRAQVDIDLVYRF
ncbi:MAG: hypothetical protein WCE63_13370 [Acidobacteriaceae bacterium]